jgi:hypothetical protein
MRNLVRLFGIAIVLALPLLPSVACLQESPDYEPQYYYENSRGPSGTSAFISGEASKTGLKPVKEGARTDIAPETSGSTEKDVAQTPEVVVPDKETDCDDGVDEDRDGFTDCQDEDCLLDTACGF